MSQVGRFGGLVVGVLLQVAYPLVEEWVAELEREQASQLRLLRVRREGASLEG